MLNRQEYKAQVQHALMEIATNLIFNANVLLSGHFLILANNANDEALWLAVCTAEYRTCLLNF